MVLVYYCTKKLNLYMKHILSADSGFLSKRIGNGMKYVLQGLELARGSQTKKYSWMQQQNKLCLPMPGFLVSQVSR